MLQLIGSCFNLLNSAWKCKDDFLFGRYTKGVPFVNGRYTFERGIFSAKNGILKDKGSNLRAEPPRVSFFLVHPPGVWLWDNFMPYRKNRHQCCIGKTSGGTSEWWLLLYRLVDVTSSACSHPWLFTDIRMNDRMWQECHKFAFVIRIIRALSLVNQCV